jgi:hypothetical protein
MYSPESEYINPLTPPPPLQVSLDVNDPNFQQQSYLCISTQYKEEKIKE